MHFKHVSLLTIISLPIIPIILAKFYKTYYRNLLRNLYESDQRDISKIISISFENDSCRKHIAQSSSCGTKCSYEYLQYVIRICDLAVSSIKLCMYQITSREIHDALIRASNRRVTIQLITDKEIAYSSGSQIKHLLTAGIAVKSPLKTDQMFHHKFGLIDADLSNGQVFYGTLNWTIQAFCSNFDVVIFSTCDKQIKRFNEEFSMQWALLTEMKY